MKELKDILYQHILDYLSQNSCDRILEIGTCTGDTAQRMLQCSKNKQVIYHGIDLFEDATPEIREKEVSLIADSMNAVLKRLTRYSKFVFLHRGLSTKVFPKLKQLGITFDCIWIDGGHSYKTVKYDFEHYSQLLTPNGIIFLDDYTSDPFLQGVRRFIDENLLNNNRYFVSVYNQYVDSYRSH